MSLPIHTLRKRLQELIKIKKRGYMATLSELSGIPDGTIHRIAYGKQKTVTYKVWKKLHDVAPELPSPLSMVHPASEKGSIDPALVKDKEDSQVTDLDAHYGPESATTRHPEIVQIVKMAESLGDKKIHMIKEFTLKLLISQMGEK